MFVSVARFAFTIRSPLAFARHAPFSTRLDSLRGRNGLAHFSAPITTGLRSIGTALGFTITLSVLPRCPDPSRDAPSVLSATVTDKLRSAPVALLDQGNGAMPVGHGHPAPGSWEPQKIVGAPPRSKWSARGAGSQIGGSAPRGRRPTPRLARWQGRLGHVQSSVAHGGRWRCPIQICGLLGQPL